MRQNILNGVYLYKPEEFSEVHTENYIEKIMLKDINKEIEGDDCFMVDIKGNICIFDYVIKDEKKNLRGKCYLIYKIGKNYNFYNLIESKEQYGCFIKIGGRQYQLQEVKDNKKIRIIENTEELNSFFSESCNITRSDNTLSNISSSPSSMLICNFVVYNENCLNYFLDKTLRYKKFDLKYKKTHKESLEKIIQKYINTYDFNNHTRINHFLMTTENGEKHFCSLISNRNGSVTVISMSDYFMNSDYISATLYNEINLGRPESVEPLLNTPLLSPCNIAIKTSELSLLISTESLPPKIDLNYNFVIKILACLLNERQMIFYSNRRTIIFKVIIFFLKIIRPFNYKFFISTRLPNEIKAILSSPFPFLLGTDEKIKTGLIFIDLDHYEMFNFPGDLLPFEKELRRKLRKSVKKDMNVDYWSVFKHYFVIIKNNLDIARETLISKNLKNTASLRKLIFQPEIIKAEVKNLEETFTDGFLETRIFKEYISSRRDFLVLNYAASFLDKKKDLFFNSRIKLSSKSEIKYLDPFIYKLFLVFHREDPKNIIDHISSTPQILELVAPDILELYSSKKNYEKIYWFIELLRNQQIEITPEMFSCINYFESREEDEEEMIELQDFMINVFHTCKCNKVSENVRKFIGERLDEEDREDFFNLKVEKGFYDESGKHRCGCKSYFHGLIIERAGKVLGIYEMFLPRDLFVFFKRSRKTRLSKLEKNFFWNVITYFLLYDLPINNKAAVNEEFELIIEENNGKRHFNLLNLPSIKFLG